MFSKKNSKWDLSIAGVGTFVLGTILNLILDPNIYAILGFLTAAVILVIANIIYVIWKSINEKK